MLRCAAVRGKLCRHVMAQWAVRSRASGAARRCSGAAPRSDGADAEALRVTVVGAVGNVALAVVKGAAGWATGSAALLADAGHSLSDLFSDAITYGALRLAREPPDENHPYGHRKFEALGALSVAGILVLTAGGLGWHALDALTATISAPAPRSADFPAAWGVAAAAVSLAGKEAMYQWTRAVATRQRSSVLMANAWHHRSDALSSVVALFGVGASMMGAHSLDPVAGILVAGMIGMAGVEIATTSVSQLTDEVDPRKTQLLQRALARVPGVGPRSVLRTRPIGEQVAVEVQLELVDERSSASTAHQVAEHVRLTLMRSDDAVADVVVHVHPSAALTAGALQRCGPLHAAPEAPTQVFRPHHHIETDVRAALSTVPRIDAVTHVTIHFLNAQVIAEVALVVAPALRVAEVHSIAKEARLRVLAAVPEVTDADVHLELQDR